MDNFQFFISPKEPGIKNYHVSLQSNEIEKNTGWDNLIVHTDNAHRVEHLDLRNEKTCFIYIGSGQPEFACAPPLLFLKHFVFPLGFVQRASISSDCS